jgi:hypothetical protein
MGFRIFLACLMVLGVVLCGLGLDLIEWPF